MTTPQEFVKRFDHHSAAVNAFQALAAQHEGRAVILLAAALRTPAEGEMPGLKPGDIRMQMTAYSAKCLLLLLAEVTRVFEAANGPIALDREVHDTYAHLADWQMMSSPMVVDILGPRPAGQ